MEYAQPILGGSILYYGVVMWTQARFSDDMAALVL